MTAYKYITREQSEKFTKKFSLRREIFVNSKSCVFINLNFYENWRCLEAPFLLIF
jgi:hypothetical protein